MQVPSVRTLLMNLEYLKSAAVWCEVADMYGIAMAMPSSIEQITVIINST